MQQVTVQREGRIAFVSFERPGPANALSLALMRELTDVARGFEEDHETSAVVLSGVGENFCLGFDLKDPELAGLRDAPLSKRRMAFQVGTRMCRAWEEIPALTISAIEGWCVGGGVALAVSTDLRIASDPSMFYVPEVERGLNMSWGSVPRITNLVGPARAKRLIILAEQMSAARAVDWGLIDETAPADEVMAAARSMAERASEVPPVALRMCKQGINSYANALAHTASALDHEQFTLSFDSEDAAEGIAAFVDKRAPRFSGN